MDGRQSLKKPYAPGQCASTHRCLHRLILQGMVLPGHRFLSSICCVRSPIGCVPFSSSLSPISLHSTTSFSLVKNPSTRRPRNKKAAPGCPGSSPNRRTMELRAVPPPAAALTRHRCSGRGLFPFFLPTRVRVASKSSARASRVSSKRQEAITASLPYRQDHGVARPSPVCCATILLAPIF